jgi:hypothetical protein
MAVAAPMDPAALKKRLGLDIGKCGSNTLKNRPCRFANPSNIDRQIMSMTTLTQASPELLDQLKVLAELALCYHHIKPVPKAARIKDWKKVFPVGDEKAVPIEPIEDQIKSVLDCFPYTSEYTCVGANRDGMQCGHKIGGKWIRRGKKTVALILKPEHYSHHRNLTFLLNVLASNMFCYHHKEQVPDRVAEWESRITTIYRAYPMQDRPLRSTGNTGLSRKFQGNPAEFWDDADDTSAFVTEIEKNRPLDYKACYSLVRDKMKEPLKKEELDPGYVYVYEVEGNKGFVKIGFTTQTIERRSEQWKFQCDRVPKVLYPLGPAEKIPHANRVEGLCLAELKYRNVIVICEACPKQHIEWVQVSAAEAIAVIQKWTKWINTTPFHDSERPLTRWQLANGITSWTLRNKEVQRTADMPKFMQEIAAASPSAGQQRPRREASTTVSVGSQSSRREIAVASPSAGHQRPRREASATVSIGSQSSRKEIAVASPSAGRQRPRREALAAVSTGS